MNKTISLTAVGGILAVVVAWQAIEWPATKVALAAVDISSKQRDDNILLIVLYGQIDRARDQLQEAQNNPALARELQKRIDNMLRQIKALEK